MYLALEHELRKQDVVLSKVIKKSILEIKPLLSNY